MSIPARVLWVLSILIACSLFLEGAAYGSKGALFTLSATILLVSCLFAEILTSKKDP